MEIDEAQNEIVNEPVQNDVDSSNENGNSASDDDVNMIPTENSSHSVNGSDKITDTDCLVQLVFRDSETFDDLHQVIGQCIRDALFKLKRPTDLIIDKDENCVKVTEISNEKNVDNIFMVDIFPTADANDVEIPDYNSSAIDVLNDETSNETETNDESKPKTGNCWNCSGDHNMRDCKEKRDPIAISRAKQQFMQRPRTERYHLESEQKYSSLVPGKITDNLRQALGLRSRELPLYIYKMRLYGYPTGWLEDAKINNSGLTLFHSETKISADIDVEDGEVDRITFDPSKFIDYPGFNAPVPSNFIDEGDYHRVPPMQFSNSKEGLIQQLQNNLAKTYKRKRLKLDVDEKSATENVKDDDMELQNSDDENTKRPATMFPQPGADVEKPVPDEEASLTELERKQEELRRALEDASSDSNSIPSDQNVAQIDELIAENQTTQPEIETVTETESTQPALSSEEKTSIESETIVMGTIEKSVSAEQLDDVLNTPKAVTAGRSREAMFGTPIIKQISPFTTLPDGDKWSVGVTDVIDFENLPDTTGAYQKLTGVIKKVRSVIKQINDDTEHDSS